MEGRMSSVKGNGDLQMKVGEFLVKNSIITDEQLKDALDLQKDNPDRLIGEILVTQGILTKEDIIMALEMFLMVTDSEIDFTDEWLDQDEVDLIINRIKNKNSR
jgi:hypothetical protein